MEKTPSTPEELLRLQQQKPLSEQIADLIEAQEIPMGEVTKAIQYMLASLFDYHEHVLKTEKLTTMQMIEWTDDFTNIGRSLKYLGRVRV
jgi:hypothetical protein